MRSGLLKRTFYSKITNFAQKMVNINEKRFIEFGKDEKENRYVVCIIDQEKIFLEKNLTDGGIIALAEYILV